MKETRDIQIRFAIDDAGTFSGHAVIFGEMNRHREFYRPGAFAKSLAEHRAAGTNPPCLFAHDPAQIVGVWTSIKEDTRGLAVEGQLLMDTVRGREVASMLKAKALSGISLGFRPRKQTRGANGTVTITDVDLVEISLVATPSANGARIASYRQSPSRNDALAGFIAACRRARQSMEKTR